MRTVRAIVVAGSVAALLDGLAAVVQSFLSRGTSPVLVFQFIASGLIGRSAFDGGIGTSALGLGLHIFIATTWAGFFFLVYPRWSVVQRTFVATVVGYGIIIWCVMNLVVVPLSQIPFRPFTVAGILTSSAILVVCVSLPIVYLCRRFHRRGPQLSPPTALRG